MGQKQFYLLHVHFRLPGASWEKVCNLADFNSWLPTSTGLNTAWKSAVSLESFAFHISASIISNLCSSPQTFLHSLFLIHSFQRKWKPSDETTSTSCQQIFKPTCLCTPCPSFLPVITQWRCSFSSQRSSFPLPASYPLPPSEDISSISFIYFQLLCLLYGPRVLSSTLVIHFFASHLPCNPINLPSLAIPLHSAFSPLHSSSLSHQCSHLLYPMEALLSWSHLTS